MPLLRLLSASLFASAFVLQAVAQAPVTPLTQTTVVPLTLPKTFTISALPAAASVSFLQTTKPVPLQFKISKVPPTTLLAQVNTPCYTMRSYNFTAQDLQSATPRPSSHTDCTPASSVRLKEVLGVAAK